MSSLTLRPASSRLDARNILTWRNDPAARQSAMDGHEISWEEHWAWFNQKIADKTALLFVGESMGGPVGCVRVDVDPEGGLTGEVDILVAPAFRGQGIGTQLLRLLCQHCREHTALKTLTAKIKPDNRASRAVFEANGFSHAGQRRLPGGLVDYYACALR